MLAVVGAIELLMGMNATGCFEQHTHTHATCIVCVPHDQCKRTCQLANNTFWQGREELVRQPPSGCSDAVVLVRALHVTLRACYWQLIKPLLSAFIG